MPLRRIGSNMNLEENFPKFLAKFGYRLQLHDAVIHRIYHTDEETLIDIKFQIFLAPIGEKVERMFEYVLRFIKPNPDIYALKLKDDIYECEVATENGVVTVSILLNSGETLSFTCWGIEELSLEEWFPREPYRITSEDRNEIEGQLCKMIGATLVRMWRLVGNQKFDFYEDPNAPEGQEREWTIAPRASWEVSIGGVCRLSSEQFKRYERTDDQSVYDLIYSRSMTGYCVSETGELTIQLEDEIDIRVKIDSQAEEGDSQWAIVDPERNHLALLGNGLETGCKAYI